jgi:hypothetical protein
MTDKCYCYYSGGPHIERKASNKIKYIAGIICLSKHRDKRRNWY